MFQVDWIGVVVILACGLLVGFMAGIEYSRRK